MALSVAGEVAYLLENGDHRTFLCLYPISNSVIQITLKIKWLAVPGSAVSDAFEMKPSHCIAEVVCYLLGPWDSSLPVSSWPPDPYTHPAVCHQKRLWLLIWEGLSRHSFETECLCWWCLRTYMNCLLFCLMFDSFCFIWEISKLYVWGEGTKIECTEVYFLFAL